MKFLLLFSLFISISSFAQSKEPEIRDLFDRYDRLMSGEKMKSQEIFTQNFIEEFDSSELNYKMDKSNYTLEIKQGVVDKNLFFVKRIFDKDHNSATFIIVKEKNSWRIQGTISDDL